MLLIRVVEQETEQTWFQLKKIFSTLQVGIHKTLQGDIWQTGQIRPEMADLLKTLNIKSPAEILDFPTPPIDDR